MSRTRYVTLAKPPKGWASEPHVPEDRPNCTVYEAEREPRDTGLLDASGVRLFAVEDREPIGFQIGGKHRV